MVLSNKLKFDILREYYKNGESLIATKQALFQLYSKDESIRKLPNKTILRVIKNMSKEFKLLKYKPPGRSRSVLANRNVDRVKHQFDRRKVLG